MIYCIGECMIEFSRADGELFRRSFAGDVYNTAVYANRLAQKGGDVEFVTAIGDDAASEAMVSAWRAEGVSASHAAVMPGRTPGLYVIETDDDGERRFSYWRNQSAARGLIQGVRTIDPAALSKSDVIYYSGITLAILEGDDRQDLFTFIKQARKTGARIAFDPNYRPALWESREAAADAIMHAYGLADVVLTGAEEEQSLFGWGSEHSELGELERLGVKEAILKAGERGVYGRCGGAEFHVPFVPAQAVVDTTAAGDSFAGAYLAFRLRGVESEQAVTLAAAAARIVVSYPGAIIDRAHFAEQVNRDPELSKELSHAN